MGHMFFLFGSRYI